MTTIRRTGLPIHAVPAVLAGISGGLAVVVVVYGEALWAVGLGLVMHALAVYAAMHAARVRRGSALSEVESDTVFWTAALVPFWGPLLAWAFPRADSGSGGSDAQEVMERYAGHVQPRIPDYERTLFTGDHDKDLARELDAESFREVLRHGDTLQKRNALRGLAELGQPHHLQLIRDCLTDDDHEVRLYAVGELQRLTMKHDSRIAKATAQREETPRDPVARMDLARAHFELAASGILDTSTAAFHFRAAVTNADTAREAEPDDVQALLLAAVATARKGDLDDAEERLSEVSILHVGRADVALARAEVAFVRRDFANARAHLVRLRDAGAEPPEWLRALEPIGGFDDGTDTMDSFTDSAHTETATGDGATETDDGETDTVDDWASPHGEMELDLEFDDAQPHDEEDTA